MNIDIIKKEIKSPALKEIAHEIIRVTNGIYDKSVEPDQARLSISGCKHLIQLMALEKMKAFYLKTNADLIG